MKDSLAAERRSLPWVRIEKDYVFDAPTGPKTNGTYLSSSEIDSRS
jgi:predicted dithiol-disulfide oxidoreductase (DUF899 family)